MGYTILVSGNSVLSTEQIKLLLEDSFELLAVDNAECLKGKVDMIVNRTSLDFKLIDIEPPLSYRSYGKQKAQWKSEVNKRYRRNR